MAMSNVEVVEEEAVDDKKQRKRRSYDVAFKLEVISYAEAHNKTQAAKHYGVHRRCVQTWAQRKEKLEQTSSKRMRPTDEEAEREGVERAIAADTQGQLLTALPVTCANSGVDDVTLDAVVMNGNRPCAK